MAALKRIMKRTQLKANPDKVRAWKLRSKPMNRGNGFKNTGSTLSSGTGLKTRTTLKARKPMNKVGKVGRANIAANKKIKAHAEANSLDQCEICALGMEEFKDIECVGSFALTTAHKHKRAWYKGDPDLLSDPKQWVKACVTSHDRIEHDEALTEEVFSRLRK